LPKVFVVGAADDDILSALAVWWISRIRWSVVNVDLSLLKILEMSERPVVRKFEKAKPQANRFRNCGKDPCFEPASQNAVHGPALL
jgi:hypothetical protein